MTTVTDWAVANFADWTDESAVFNAYFFTADYVWDDSQETVADVVANGGLPEIVFGLAFGAGDRTASGTTALAADVTGLTATSADSVGHIFSSGTASQLLVIWGATDDDTHIVAQIDLEQDPDELAILLADTLAVAWDEGRVFDVESLLGFSPTITGATGDGGGGGGGGDDGRACHPNFDVPEFVAGLAGIPDGNWEDAATEWDEPLGTLGSNDSAAIISSDLDVTIAVDTDLHATATLTVTDYDGDETADALGVAGVGVFTRTGGTLHLVASYGPGLSSTALLLNSSSIGTVVDVNLTAVIPPGVYEEVQVLVFLTTASLDGSAQGAWAWKVENLDAYTCATVVTNFVSLQLHLKDGSGPAWVDIGGPIAPLTSRGGTKDDPGVTIIRTSTQQNQYSRYNSGRITATLENRDGQWDSTNLDGPWVTDGKTLLHEGLPVRLFITPDGEDPMPLFNGKVSDWSPAFLGNIWSDVPFVGVDAADALRAANLTALQAPVGAGDSAGQRIQRILDSIGWTGGTDIDDRLVHPLQGTTLAQGAWAEILLAADSDGGFVWIDRFGKLVYRLRDYALDLEPSLVLSMNEEDGTYLYSDLTPNNDTSLLFNVAKLARVGGKEQAAIASDAATSYAGYRTTSRSDLLLQTEVDVMDQAQWTVGMSRSIGYRPARVVATLKRSSPTEEWLAVAPRDVGDLIEVRQVTPDGRTIVGQGIISGVTALIRPQADVFKFTFDLTPAPPRYGPYFFDDDAAIFDDPGVVFAFERSA